MLLLLLLVVVVVVVVYISAWCACALDCGFAFEGQSLYVQRMLTCVVHVSHTNRGRTACVTSVLEWRLESSSGKPPVQQ